eukprot:3225-Heterococcus_DN1.PRE.1
MMSYGGGKSGLGDALGDVLQTVRAKDEEIVRFKVELERQSRRCQSSDQERKRAQEALQTATNAVSEHVREIRSLEGTVADLRATVERQAREQGSREALLTAAEGQIKELQGECQQERVRFSDILQKVNAAFKAKHFGGSQAAEDTPETAAAAPPAAAAAAAPAAVAPGGLSAEEAAELKQRVVDSEKKAEAAA